MFNTKLNLFNKTKYLEKKIDLMHDRIIDIAMIFRKAIKLFLTENRSEEYKKLNKQIKQIEHDNDTLRRDIENELYVRNLIPDLRGNVLQLVESLDKVVNKFDEVSYKFYIERPQIDIEYHSRINDLCSEVSECVENMVIASRAYFRNFHLVRDYAQKVYFLENTTDLLSGKLRESIFDSELPLANKMQICSFVSAIADIADIAEDCIDQLLIFSIKRDI